MQELPKSVIERLKGRPGAQEHPDADLLTAFSEQALTGRERELVLAHLAVCAACRETVALALPKFPAAQPVTAYVPWFRRPRTFAWAGIAATVAVAASLAVNYQFRRDSAPATALERGAETAATAKVPVSKTQPMLQAESKNRALVADRAKTKEAAAFPQKQAQVAASADALMLKKEATAAPAVRSSAMAVAPTPPAQKPPAKDGKLPAGGRDQRTDEFAAQLPAPKPAAPGAAMESAVAAKNQAAPEAQSVEIQSAPPPLAKSAGIVGGLAAENRAAPASKAKLDKVSTETRWSISEAGQLQRSLDSGRNWQPVTVDRQASFRSLAAVGDNVWAGGPGAVLYHSADSGGHWTRQTLPGSSATIVSLEFSDAQHGVARTADELAWSTSDGGRHWTKQ